MEGEEVGLKKIKPIRVDRDSAADTPVRATALEAIDNHNSRARAINAVVDSTIGLINKARALVVGKNQAEIDGTLGKQTLNSSEVTTSPTTNIPQE